MPAPKKAPKDQTKPERPTTTYVLLRLADEQPDDENQTAWVELGEISAHSDVQAIRSYIDKRDVPPEADKRETYIACPVRSFKSHVVQAETQTKLHID